MKSLILKPLLVTAFFIVGCQSAPEVKKTPPVVIETSYLKVCDMTGQLSIERLRNLANAAQKSLENILKYWLANARIDELGKIKLELHGPFKVGQWEVSSADFVPKEGRVVVVWVGNNEPEVMVTKLTIAVFFHPDKLIRVIMGAPTETKFGNYLSFPMCGFSTDAWVLALRQANQYIPLSELGPSHAEWGMSIGNRLPFVADFGRQQACYAEASSFGTYLLNTYGVEKIKAFGQPASIRKPRPWEEVFGVTLGTLENNWIQTLDSRYKDEERDVLTLKKLLEDDPNTARFKAHDLAVKAKNKR
jgi:hypothetical protein